jgi:hypothetical protein
MEEGSKSQSAMKLIRQINAADLTYVLLPCKISSGLIECKASHLEPTAGIDHTLTIDQLILSFNISCNIGYFDNAGSNDSCGNMPVGRLYNNTLKLVDCP